jgi:PAS domain S-box-containing protein
MTEAATSNHSSLPENSEAVSSSASEERFRSVLEASPDGFIILRSIRNSDGEIDDFTIEYANPVAARGVNRTSEELLGQNLLQLFPDCKTSGIFDRYVTVAESGNSTTFETFYDSQDVTGWFRNVVVKLNDAIAVSFNDITARKTEQKQFEESLRAANQRISNVLESITDAFVAFDHDWRYTYVNQEAGRMLGRSPQELLGQRWQDVFPEVAQQDTAASRALQQAMTERVPLRLEAFSLTSQRWVEMSVFPSSDGIASCFRDISERKRTEQRRDTQYAIARILAEATTVAEATPAILQALCENLDWQVGMVWDVDPDQSVLRFINCWQSSQVDVQEFLDVTRQSRFAQGVGLPGQVWESRQPVWISQLNQNSNFPRAALASQVGLQSAFAFPIQLGDEILGAIECFSNRIQEPDTDLLQMMAAIGSQIGQFMERKRTEAALRDSQELFQSFMNHSPIAAFIKDEAGRYLYANPWIERVYQRSQSELLGKTDFELLPPAIANQFHANDVAVLSSGQPVQTLETIHHEDGEHTYMSFKFPFRSGDGKQALAGVSIDISEQIEAEAALQRREAELRLITNAVPVLISLVDAEQRYRFNNQRYEEWWGRSVADMNGKYLWEVLGQSAYEKIRPYVEQVLAGQEVTFETRIPYAGGGIRNAVVNYVPRFDQQGNVEGFVALVTDITRRKQAEDTLQQSEERLRVAQQAANAGVWDWDMTNNQVTWSDEYYRLYGLDPVITQASYENWISSIIEQDRDRTDCAAREALEHRVNLNVEFRILHPTQGERWLTAIGQTFYDTSGQPHRMTGIALDITDRKRAETALQESEERLRLALIATNQGLYDLNVQTGEAIVSPAYAQMLGYDPDEFQESIAQWSDRLHPDDRATVYQAYENYISGKLSTYRVEFRLRTRLGNWKWILSVGKIVSWDSIGQPLRMLGTHTDITEHKQVEAEREQLLVREQAAREQAETANRIKDEFLAVLSHELRSPLNPILGWARLLQTQTLNEAKTKQALKTIERNAKLQSELIEDLLDVSRILRGKLSLNTAPVNLAATIQAAIETVRLAAEAKSIEIKATLAPHVGQVLGDSNRLQQVVWNLLSNAVKFTPSGGRVEVKLESYEVSTSTFQLDGSTQPSHRVAQIIVTDTGQGIHPKFLPHVFDYFRQADSTTTRKFGGLGLGLAIVRHLVELHGGTVQADSLGEGLGATFTVRLPLMSTRSKGSADPSSLEPTLSLRGIQILVVDDSPDTLEFVSFVLEQAGASVLTATSAIEALTTLTQSQPQLLLSDIGMPNMDGYMLIRHVRTLPHEQGGTIPAIALTAFAGEMNQQQAFAAGFQMHISKPVEPDHLISTIVKLVVR